MKKLILIAAMLTLLSACATIDSKYQDGIRIRINPHRQHVYYSAPMVYYSPVIVYAPYVYRVQPRVYYTVSPRTRRTVTKRQLKK